MASNENLAFHITKVFGHRRLIDITPRRVADVPWREGEERPFGFRIGQVEARRDLCDPNGVAGNRTAAKIPIN